MKRRLKSAAFELASGLATGLALWAVYRGPFARIVNVLLAGSLAGGIAWMIRDLYKWMYRGRMLGATELAIKPQFPRAMFAFPVVALAGPIVLVASGMLSRFPAGRSVG